jgi:hypothetical protein
VGCYRTSKRSRRVFAGGFIVEVSCVAGTGPQKT